MLLACDKLYCIPAQSDSMIVFDLSSSVGRCFLPDFWDKNTMPVASFLGRFDDSHLIVQRTGDALAAIVDIDTEAYDTFEVRYDDDTFEMLRKCNLFTF